jgi:hypothetical protein
MLLSAKNSWKAELGLLEYEPWFHFYSATQMLILTVT